MTLRHVGAYTSVAYSKVNMLKFQKFTYRPDSVEEIRGLGGRINPERALSPEFRLVIALILARPSLATLVSRWADLGKCAPIY